MSDAIDAIDAIDATNDATNSTTNTIDTATSDTTAAVMARSGHKEGGEVRFRCPAHSPDDHPSARWNPAKRVWRCDVCQAGGGELDLRRRLGLNAGGAASTNGGKPSTNGAKPTIATTYDYLSDRGELLYQVVRMDPKDFSQRRPDGGGAWIWNVAGVARVPYRLPQLLAAGSEATVFVVEGEKDCDLLAELGLIATTNSGGARKWHTDYTLHFSGLVVVLLLDNDDAGEAHGAMVAPELAKVAQSVRVVRLPGLPPKGDVSDWLETHTVSELEQIVEATPEWRQPKTPELAAGPDRGVEPTLGDFHTTDSGNGELFAFLYGSRVRYDHARGRWLVWNEHWWQDDGDGEVVRLTKEAARRRYVAAVEIDDREERAAVARFAISSESRPKIDAALAMARSELPVADAGHGWDEDPWLLGVANGVVDLRTGARRAGRQADKITRHLSLEYDAGAGCPRFLAFLEEVFGCDDGLIGFVRRAIGYSLTGSTREQVLFLCHGSGSNGKSVLLNVVRRLLDVYAANVSFTVLANGQHSVGGFDLAPLHGKRFVCSSETNEGSRLDESRIKALTGGDPITAAHKYQNAFTFTPEAKFWLAVNHLPVVHDDSDGFWRRVRLIPFRRQFKGDDIDVDLELKLSAELAGILAWAVRGSLEWQRDGLQSPTVVLAATTAYREESDPLGPFYGERCVIAPNVRVERGVLFKAYSGWCDDQGIGSRERLGSRVFGQRVSEQFENVKSHGVRSYRGIGLVTAQERGMDFDKGRNEESSGIGQAPPDQPQNREMDFEGGRNEARGDVTHVWSTNSQDFSGSLVHARKVLENSENNVPHVPRVTIPLQWCAKDECLTVALPGEPFCGVHRDNNL